jgi:hypothetical protein
MTPINAVSGWALAYKVLSGSTLMLHTHADAQRRRLRRVGKTRQSAPDVGARRLGQDEQYLTVREILSEARTLVPPKAGLSRERSDFYRFEYATLGFTLLLQSTSFQRQLQICDGPFPTRCGVLCFLHIF